MPRSESIDFLLRVRGAGAAQRDFDKTGKSVERSGKRAKTAGDGFHRAGRGLGSLAAGAGIMAAAAYGITSAVTATTNLARSTIQVSRATGMDAKQASLWAGMTQTRGIEAKQLSTMFVRLNRSIVAGRKGTKGSIEQWGELGVTMGDLKKLPTERLLMKAADGIKAMKDPASRSAAATALFGKQGTKLLPILAQGAKGITAEKAELERLGVVMGSTKEAKDQIAAQRTFNRAMLGLKVTLGEKVIPVLTDLFEAFGDIMENLQPILRNKDVVKAAIGVLAGAWIGYKIATAGAAISQWGLNIAILSSPWFWLVAAILLAAAAVIYLYVKFKWYRDYIKSQLPGIIPTIVQHKSMLGSIGLVIDRLISKSGGLKRQFGNTWSGMKQAVRAFWGWLSGVGESIWSGLKSGFRAAMNWIIGKWNSLSFTVPKVDLGPAGSFGGTTIQVPQIAPLARGGTVARAGSALVGEAGPELLTLPAGARVTPLPALAAAAAGAGGGTIVTKVYLDKRQIAEAVADVAAGRMARR